METSPVAGVAFLLFLLLLVPALIGISRSLLKLKAALHILAGMAAGLAAGIAVGALSGSGKLAGHLAFLLMFCGGIWVSVRKIRRARSARTAELTATPTRVVVASATSWKHERFKDGIPLPYQAIFDGEQFARLKTGFIPQEMEDKWFIYYEEPHLFFHRSWTGSAVYRLALRSVQKGAEVTEALLSRDLAEAPGMSSDYEVQVLDYMVSSFLLGQSKPFPPPQPPLPLPMHGVVLGTCYAQSPAKPKRPWWRIW